MYEKLIAGNAIRTLFNFYVYIHTYANDFTDSFDCLGFNIGTIDF